MTSTKIRYLSGNRLRENKGTQLDNIIGKKKL